MPWALATDEGGGCCPIIYGSRADPMVLQDFSRTHKPNVYNVAIYYPYDLLFSLPIIIIIINAVRPEYPSSNVTFHICLRQIHRWVLLPLPALLTSPNPTGIRSCE